MFTSRSDPGVIRQLGDPVLRERTVPVVDFGAALGRLVERMVTVMHAADGVGLAAPQIGVGLALFVMDCAGVQAVVANPVIDLPGGVTDPVVASEGCLSLAGRHAPTPRAPHAVVIGQGADGRPVRVEGRGLVARCLQHETDHLRGVLYVDHLPPAVRRTVLLGG